MPKRKQKILSIVIVFILTVALGMNCYAHSGRTDKNGGHKDNQNKSGLGNYHYHCGGHPAHLHPNGVCPYNSNSKTTTTPKSTTTKKNTQKLTTTAVKTTQSVPEKTNISRKDDVKM